MIETILGNILNSKEKYIAHQTNCVSNGAAGLAYTLFTNYPYSDDYSTRTDNSVAGTINIKGNGQDQRYIINMFGQFYPGKYRNGSGFDSEISRESYFQSCLNEIFKIKDLESIAFPYKIGCNLAGGNWDHYLKMLEGFEKSLNNVKVIIYKHEV